MDKIIHLEKFSTSTHKVIKNSYHRINIKAKTFEYSCKYLAEVKEDNDVIGTTIERRWFFITKEVRLDRIDSIEIYLSKLDDEEERRYMLDIMIGGDSMKIDFNQELSTAVATKQLLIEAAGWE